MATPQRSSSNRCFRHSGLFDASSFEMPPEADQARRIEAEYDRNGALQYLAAWDVHRGIIMGRCEQKNGIKSFRLLVDQVGVLV